MPTTLVIEPDALDQAGTWTVTGAGDALTAVTDASDASYLLGDIEDNGVGGKAVFGLPSPTIPGGRFISGVSVNSKGTFDVGTIEAICRIALAGVYGATAAVHDGHSTGVPASSGYMATKPGGGAWTAADVAAAVLELATANWTSGGATIKVQELWVNVQYTDEPTAPTNVTPAAGSAQSTDVPTLSATLVPVGSASTGARPLVVTWLIASDAGFTTNLRTITEPNSAAKVSGVATLAVPTAEQLFTGTWFIKARATDDLGTVGAWSTTNSFTVSHAPSTTGHTPTGGHGRDFGGAGEITASWTFSDPSPVDAQTAYQIVVERNDTGTLVLDTGKVVSTADSAVLTIPAIQKDQPLRWKIRVYDSDDVVGAYSLAQLFQASDAPVGAITSPTPAEVVANPAPTITWTFTATDRTQASYRVRILDGATVVYDSTTVTSSVVTHTLPDNTLSNNTAYTVELTVSDNLTITSVPDTVAFTADWAEPAAPVFTVDATGYETVGFVAVEWTDDEMDADFLAWRVYRRRLLGAWVLLHETDVDQATYEHHDWLAGSGTTYEYAVVQVAARFDAPSESAYDPTEATPTSSDYWLIHPDDESINRRIPIVTGDSYSEEYEQETMHIIGRGRKTDYGDRLGFTGTLVAQIRDTATQTAREAREDLLAIKAERREFYLRNPFGDLWQVSMGDIAVSRLSGVGMNEYVDVVIPYQEVA